MTTPASTVMAEILHGPSPVGLPWHPLKATARIPSRQQRAAASARRAAPALRRSANVRRAGAKGGWWGGIFTAVWGSRLGVAGAARTYLRALSLTTYASTHHWYTLATVPRKRPRGIPDWRGGGFRPTAVGLRMGATPSGRPLCSHGPPDVVTLYMRLVGPPRSWRAVGSLCRTCSEFRLGVAAPARPRQLKGDDDHA